MKNLLTIAFLSFTLLSSAQTKTDSETYWENANYIACLDSGKSVCHCQEQNNFTMLKIDAAKNKLAVQPSVFTSHEIFEFDLRKSRKEKNTYIILPGNGLDSGSAIVLEKDLLTLINSRQTLTFRKSQKPNTSDELTMREQTGIINCRPLLKYAVKPCTGATLFLTADDLSDYISKGRVSIYCSEDYHYNEMRIKNSEMEYFLTYETNAIKIYKRPKKQGDLTLDISTLSECQLFYKSKTD